MKRLAQKRNRKGERGSILATSAIGMLSILLAVGLGVDISRFYLAKTELQNAADAAALMSEKKVGSVIVTKNGRPFGIVTERDLIRRYFRDTLLESLASRPLITAETTTTVDGAAEIMLKNEIRKLPIIDENNLIVGIVTVTDLATFLSPTRRPGLTLSILRAISRGREPKCDSCNSTTEVQWCDDCNRFMCQTCEDEIHTVDLP